MRINSWVAQATGLSRRVADKLIADGQVLVNGLPATTGQQVDQMDTVVLDGNELNLPGLTTVMLNKPPGYVCSRDGQGSQTIYDLLPEQYHNLKSVGRLDKDSSGLLLMTNDGKLAQQLTHPSQQKNKVYQVTLDRPLTVAHRKVITTGVTLEDGPSKLQLDGTGKNWQVTMHEGRNRQIRRTFQQLGYRVITLHRVKFGSYDLGKLESGKHRAVN